MNRTTAILAASILATTLSACGSNSLFSRDRPDEMMVSRQAPLVVPPDFALNPPAPGTPRVNEPMLTRNFGTNAAPAGLPVKVPVRSVATSAAAGGEV